MGDIRSIENPNDLKMLDILESNLFSALKALGWSENELIRRSGVSKGFMTNLKNRKTTPNLASLNAIANALNMTASHLLRDEEFKPKQIEITNENAAKRTFDNLYKFISSQEPELFDKGYDLLGWLNDLDARIQHLEDIAPDQGDPH